MPAAPPPIMITFPLNFFLLLKPSFLQDDKKNKAKEPNPAAFKNLRLESNIFYLPFAFSTMAIV